VQPKAVDYVRDATTNSCLRKWLAKPATACSKSSYESDSYYPNHAEVREAPTNYRRNPWEQVKAYYYSDEYYSDDEYSRDPNVDYAETTCYQPGISTRSSHASGAFHHDISTQPWQCQPNSSSGKSLVKQDPQNRSYPRPRKARKRHKKKHPKPSPPSPPVAGALCAQTKETRPLPDHPPIPPTMESSYEHKKMPNQGIPNKAERAQPTETHPPTIHPPYPLTMESFYRWYAEQGCPKPDPDYSWTPNVSKAPEKAQATISSESDSDSHYSGRFDGAKAPDPTPPNAHMGRGHPLRRECPLNQSML
jgi:hypothetical protein